MGQNIEIKARLSTKEFDRIKAKAAEIATEPHVVLVQKDTFFRVPRDRLKLREFDDDSAELIAYSRIDTDDPTISSYSRTIVVQPDSLKQSLARTIGIAGVIQKRRDLFIHNQTRIHLDTVDQLGQFLELEVVLQPDQTAEIGIETANELMTVLRIDPDWLISGAYIDLLLEL